MAGYNVSYERQKIDRMERGEHHKKMRNFIRGEELGEHHFISEKKSAKSILRW